RPPTALLLAGGAVLEALLVSFLRGGIPQMIGSHREFARAGFAIYSLACVANAPTVAWGCGEGGGRARPVLPGRRGHGLGGERAHLGRVPGGDGVNPVWQQLLSDPGNGHLACGSACVTVGGAVGLLVWGWVVVGGKQPDSRAEPDYAGQVQLRAPGYDIGVRDGKCGGDVTPSPGQGDPTATAHPRPHRRYPPNLPHTPPPGPPP